MALGIDRIYHEYQQYMEAHRDQRSLNFPLVKTIWPVLMLIVTYLYVVLRAGPKYMEQRKAYDLKSVIRIYNIVQVIANGAYCLASVYYMLTWPNFSFKCQPVDYSETTRGYEELYLTYGYFLLKALDLADTVFFVLRKKQSHVSFLHVYHHSAMMTLSFVAVLFVPGGHVLMLGTWNSLVHAVMYFYYYLASYRSQSSWKKYLTRLQLVQFIHMGFHFGRPALLGLDCGFPKFWNWVGFFQAVVILSMFLDFYVKAYVSKGRGSAKKKT